MPVALVAAALLLAACSSATGTSAPAATSTPATPPGESSSASATAPPSASPVGRTAWLCRPDIQGTPCSIPLDVTEVTSQGRRTVEVQAAASPVVDCFYVYPTVSTATTRNAPLASAPEIVRVVQAQAVQMQRSCRLFVPLYRQITLRGLLDGGLTDPAARGLAQADVVAAFREYLDRFSDGRPFLLLGHSQGATVLTSLVQTEIDGDPALRSRLVSAMLIGGGVWLAPGSATQGTFQNVPPCRSTTQTGCVIAYNTYGSAPPASGLFGRTTNGRTTLCVNPAALGGGAATLDAIVPVPSAPGALDVVGFASFPGSLRGQCRSDPSHTWLQVDRSPGSQLPAGTLRPTPSPAWGLHRYDVTVALGDLVRLAARQGAAMTASVP
jgi:hypothetical protein